MKRDREIGREKEREKEREREREREQIRRTKDLFDQATPL
jgi:hypothetical protein